MIRFRNRPASIWCRCERRGVVLFRQSRLDSLKGNWRLIVVQFYFVLLSISWHWPVTGDVETRSESPHLGTWPGSYGAHARTRTHTPPNKTLCSYRRDKSWWISTCFSLSSPYRSNHIRYCFSLTVVDSVHPCSQSEFHWSTKLLYPRAVFRHVGIQVAVPTGSDLACTSGKWRKLFQMFWWMFLFIS